MGFVLHKGAVVACRHPPGLATPTQTDTRVKVSGQEVMTVMRNYDVKACGRTGSNSPVCVTGRWTKGSKHVFAGNLALAIDSGESVCEASGQSLDPKIFQKRVTAR